VKAQSKDPAQTDCAWVGYHPRAAVPALAVAGVASLLIWTGRWYLAPLSELTDWLGSWVIFAMAWCVWPALVTVYVYRAVTYTYRMTNRALLVDFGFWHSPVPPVWLSEITEVRVGTGWLSRLLGVGWVEVKTMSRVERLVGVRNPNSFAAQIRAAREGARGTEKPRAPSPT
jgi:hypothetical protein